MHNYINSGWELSLDYGYTWRKISLNLDYDTCKWRNLENNSFWDSPEKKECIGIYKRYDVFSVNDLKSEFIYLFLSGVSEKAEVFVNGKSVFKRNIVLTEDKWLEPLFVNIKPYLKIGENIIKVKVSHSKGNGILYAPAKYVFSDNELELNDFYPSVDQLNPCFFDYMNRALRRNCGKDMLEYLNGTKPLCLFWFTDVHGDDFVLERLMNFYKNNEFFFDDSIHTGDMNDLSFISDFSFWSKVKGTENVLLTIGNHENLKSHINYDWVSLNSIDQKSVYEKFYSPFIHNWGVNYTEDKTYYFKDYDNKKVRLLVMDFCLYGKDNEEQLIWFKNTLNDAKEKDYSVLIATHIVPVTGEFERINCSFSNLDSFPIIGLYGKTKEELNEYQSFVNSYIKNNGKFIAWIGGHSHFDFVGYSKEFPEQLVVIVDSCNRGHSENFCDMSRVDGEKSMDLANVLVIDTDDKLFKIVRVGADVDRYMRKRDFLCINYVTNEIYK